MYKNQTTDIGLFATAQEAARAYDRRVGSTASLWVLGSGEKG